MKRFAIGLLLFISASAGAQAPNFVPIELLRKNEVVQVNTMLPDRAGYLWIGTNKGLFRFDGLHIKQFKRADGLPDENVTAIAQDSLGRIWCGHKSGELSILEKNKISKFEPEEGSAAGLVSDILFDRSGTMWFSTNNDGLYYYKNNRLYRIDENEGLTDLFFYDLEEDHLGNIWAGSDGGVAICSLNDSKLSVKILSSDNGLPDNIIHKIREDVDSTFWFGTEDSGIIHYLPTQNKFESQPGLLLKPVNDLVMDGNNIWLATKNQGVILYDKVLKKSYVYDQNMPVVETLAKDVEGNIWYGSKKGLLRSYGNHISYLNLKEELGDDNIFALAIDPKENLWFSTQKGLFVRSKKADGNVSIKNILKGTRYEKMFIISLYADAAGFIWAGSYGEGLLQINTATNAITLISKELRNGNILSITGKDKTIWLATLGGATRITQQDKKLVFENFGSSEGLSTDYIYQVFIDSQNRVWLGTDGKGVDMMDAKGIHHVDSLRSKVVYGFAEDLNHKIWVNVQNDGLYYLEGNNFTPQRDSIANFQNRDINTLASTRAGNIIVAHEFGLEVFAIERRQHYYLGTEKDFQNRQPNLNAVAKDAQGNLYFGTEGGIVVYYGGIRSLPSNPVPHIESLKISNELVDVANNLVLDYEENNITFNYLGFWFQNPEGISFQYKLENYDHEWISSMDRSATYSNLPPGDYTFRLKVSKDDAFLQREEAIIHFVITPPFWKTAWFYMVCSAALLAFAYWYIRYREKKLVRAKHELEEKIKARTLEILKMNHEIKHQAEEIRAINDNLEKLVLERTNELDRKNKALQEAAFINAHNLRAPVASLLGLINLVKKLGWKDEDKEYVHHLDQSANRLDEIVSTITKAIGKGDDLPIIEEDDGEKEE